MAQTADTSEVTPLAVSYRLGTPLELMSAKVPFETGNNVLDLLTRLADAAQREAKPRRVDWRVVEALGGHAVLRPTSEPDLAERAARGLVRGLATAEREAALDPAWDGASATVAQRLTSRLGETDGTGLAIELLGPGGEEMEALVTRRAARHLREATKSTITSYGSVVGVVGRASSRPQRRAALWSDIDGRRIEVRFGEHHEEDVRMAWAKDHVVVTGVLHENSAGQVLRVDMDSLELSEQGGPSLSSLERGSYPNLTGGLSTLDYLAMIRGEE